MNKLETIVVGARECGTIHSLQLVEDPDADFVASAQDGDLEAFEELVRRHSRLIYRALVAILGDRDEAEDAMQDTFLSAFEHIGGFQWRSKFSTWLVSIARNAALQRLRHRKDVESLDAVELGEDGYFGPRQVRAWQDNPNSITLKRRSSISLSKGFCSFPRSIGWW